MIPASVSLLNFLLLAGSNKAVKFCCAAPLDQHLSFKNSLDFIRVLLVFVIFTTRSYRSRDEILTPF